MKELLFVCIGSFFGGGARYLVGKAIQSWVAVSFPWGTYVDEELHQQLKLRKRKIILPTLAVYRLTKE